MASETKRKLRKMPSPTSPKRAKPTKQKRELPTPPQKIAITEASEASNTKNEKEIEDSKPSQSEAREKKKIDLDLDFSPRKGNFERVWSEEDEMKLLRALLYCQKEYGVDPSSSIDLIHRHIHVNMNMEFTRNQVYEKIRRLKQKFEVTSVKFRSKNPGPIKPRDQALFEISQKIWRPEHDLDTPTMNGKEEETKPPSARPFLSEAFSQITKENSWFGGNGVIKKGFKFLDPSKAEELEERWKAHCIAGMKHFMETCELKKELLQACVEALNSSG